MGLFKSLLGMERHVLRTIFLISVVRNISSRYLWFEIPSNSTTEIVEDVGHVKEILSKYIWFESALQLQKMQADSSKLEDEKEENKELDSKKPHSSPLKPKYQQFND